MCYFSFVDTQGRIQTGNGSIQTLWAPKKMSPKNEEELFSDKIFK